MNRGDKVMIKSFLNQPVIRRLWSKSNNLVYFCREDAYQKWESKGYEPHCTKIRKDRVFKYDPDLYEKMTKFDDIIEARPPELDYLWQKAERL